jgi:hypothetical protein
MYEVLTANNFRLCRIQPPGAAPDFSRFGNSSVFPLSSKTSAVRGSEVERGKPRRQTVPGYHSRIQDSYDSDVAFYPVP